MELVETHYKYPVFFISVAICGMFASVTGSL